ncbi:MAG: bifunctional diguanylate cyclase/phosphodiesterase [Chloroflexota bacterium]|nr:bifunctional diguanylate cyclase/phosphodiesterase [Chloroflexota bacterium]
MKRTYLVSRLASLGVATILLILIGFSIWSVVTIGQGVNQASESIALSDQYQQARYALVKETSIELAYFSEPSASLRETQFTTATTLNNILLTLTRATDPRDRQFAYTLLAEHTRYQSVTIAMFAAIDAHNMPQAKIIRGTQIGPLFLRLQDQIDSAAARERQEAFRNLVALNQTQNTIFLTTICVFAGCLLLLAVFWRILYTYQRHLKKITQDELTRLTRMALTDTLTGLGNHQAYQEAMQQIEQQAQSSADMVGLAILDIDQFKMVNDEQGHLYGDHLLAELADLLRKAHLSQDAYRLEGDRFAVILPHISLSDALTTLEHLRQEVNHRLLGPTVSIGVALTSPGNANLPEIQEQASAALAEAKRRGRNTIVPFDDIRESAVLLPPTKIHALKRLLSERNLTIAFQPIWDIEKGVLLAFEALTRPALEYGFSGPQEAFEIAEKLGIAYELDYICLQAILERAAALPTDVLLFVNLSPQTLDHDLMTEAVLLEATLAAHLAPDHIVLELTERTIGRLPVLISKVKQLRSLGFRIALDDTGIGNAGLEMLRHVPIDFVKIDRSVVVNSLVEQASRSVMMGIQTIAREMNAYVIAEGIEDKEMLDFVQRMHVQGVQGYLLGRPSETIPTLTHQKDLQPLALT